jgi:hypothetical protein
MAWEIIVNHEEQGERVRLVIEASVQVPDDVVGGVASAYWMSEVQFQEDEWAEADDAPQSNAPSGFHG